MGENEIPLTVPFDIRGSATREDNKYTFGFQWMSMINVSTLPLSLTTTNINLIYKVQTLAYILILFFLEKTKKADKRIRMASGIHGCSSIYIVSFSSRRL